MHLIGSLIKQAIHLRKQFSSNPEDINETQCGELCKMLEKAKDTSIGLYYDFKGILEAEDPQKEFAKRVPIFDYDKMHNAWWHKTLEYPNITWPGKPDYFARSSGTTGDKPKRIPVTDEMVQSIRSVGVEQLLAIDDFDLPEAFFESQVFMLGSSTDLIDAGAHKEGEISGISASNIPTWFESVYKPGPEIAKIKDWDERVEAIVKAAPEWNIGAMSGIPSWLNIALKEIIKYHNLDTIHDIWPNLSVYTTGGVAFEPYEPTFKELFGKNVYILDTYLASEGFLAYTNRPNTKSMRLALEHGIYFEFIPFNERGFTDTGELLENPEVLTLSEVKEDQPYALIITTVSGSYRYMIGDTITFTDLSNAEIVISGRTKYWLNVVGSQLSEDKMNHAIKKLEEDLNLAVEEFTLSAVKDEESGEYYHEWIIGIDGTGPENDKVAAHIDETLKSTNKNYEVARRKALKGVKAWLVNSQKFHDWHARDRKKGGQIKTKKLLKEGEFVEFKEFMLQA